MAQTFTSVIPAPPNEVFSWHEQIGAMARISPPWLRVRIDQETDSLREGTAIMRLYGLLKWRAQHLPELFDPPRSFGDELTAGLGRTPLRWHHTHQFDDVDDGETRVTDRLVTNMPAGALRRVFAFRHRQLADELAALDRSRAVNDQKLVIGVTGSSGFVGAALCALLTTSGHRVIRFVRRETQSPDERRWDPHDPAPDLLDNVDAVAHLAGAPILGRFNDRHKARVRNTRTTPTQLLAELAATRGVDAFVTASGIGNYSAIPGSEPLDESAGPGSGFLADVITEWEAASKPPADAGVRCVQVRTGMALNPDGGVLGLMAPAFALGAGGRLGDGQQWMAWIALDDLIDIYRRALLDPALAGPINAVAPNPVRNIEFTEALGRTLKRPTFLHVPKFAPAAVLGQDGADEFALASQRAFPRKLFEAGHVFRHPQLESALSHMFGKAIA